MLGGKTAIITGSNSGIGFGVAEELARAGANVVLNSFTDRPEDHAMAADLGARFGVKARYVAADMANPESCRALIHGVGGCDILVNNAGVQHVAPVDEFPVDKWNLILAINLSSAFHTSAVALPGMRARGWGRIINIASAHGLTASPFKSAYIAAKHGVVGLSKTVALETAVRAAFTNQGQICLCGSRILVHQSLFKDAVAAITPVRRVGTADDIGAACLFLCSDDAGFITGQQIGVNGGLYI